MPNPKIFNEDINQSISYHLRDLESMVKLILKRGNLSAPSLDGIPFLKLEEE
jgi:hypothetical protein